ncbi:bile acid:sodium symporter [Helcobacillus massiliensis]|uniref:bile acid:sodium symporter n=1 Tax=Helcobacillus massiliensis TaxID=521392 RepID=UPI0021A281CB|nr:bile acid:sodium symporter [Helcobacillus massiliensis]MCT2035703.1 bile acid:sodium symporter [Helcobacillus massiliensis]MCT2330855.1 bile acid:sodium symporter [Helcobacillus massiliensis]
MRRTVDWMHRHQVAMYLLALGVGAMTGLALHAVAGPVGPLVTDLPVTEAIAPDLLTAHFAAAVLQALAVAVTPVLALLLYATFLSIPLASQPAALRDTRFLLALLVVNFLVVPLIAWVLTRPLAGADALQLAARLVLLAPCIDYVIVFTRLAGGDHRRLLAAAPVLMLAQMIALPVLMRVMLGEEMASAVSAGPFVRALLLMIVLPLLAAALTQAWAARSHAAQRWAVAADAAMVPLMMLTLAVVTASQIGGVTEQLGRLAVLIPIYAVFALVMVSVGVAAGRAVRLDGAGRRALVFSGVTRNSLVVLPLALALPPAFALAPVAVLTQTLVELVVMVVMVAVLERRPVTERRPVLERSSDSALDPDAA